MKGVLKRRIKNFFVTGNRYAEELKYELRYLILFTLGFTIAFTWREYSFESSRKFIKWLTGTSSSGYLGAALFITLICTILMILTSIYFKRKPIKYYAE